MTKNKLLKLLGFIVVIVGAAMSVYFDGNSPENAQYEKIGYILFFIGVTISIKFSDLKKKPSKGITNV